MAVMTADSAQTAESTTAPAPGLSVVVPVLSDRDDLARTHALYREGLERLGHKVEFIYVVDGPLAASIKTLKGLKRAGEAVEILALGRPFGGATALSAGFARARAPYVLTLTEAPQVKIEELAKLFTLIEDNDLVVGRRLLPDGSEPGSRRKFEYVTRLLLGSEFGDLRCGVRLMRREVAEEITLYGNQHHFLPLIAQTHGFRAAEARLAATAAPKRGSPRESASLFLDLLTAYFLIRFIKKPFRFFGGFGLAVLAFGGIVTGYLVFARLFLGEGLVDRPALILSTLMVVLGIQIISVGLIGEIITFTYAREHKDYRVERIVE